MHTQSMHSTPEPIKLPFRRYQKRHPACVPNWLTMRPFGLAYALTMWLGMLLEVGFVL
jgi:hypothetical protein